MPTATAIKCMTGHTAGASGLHSLLVAQDSMRTSTVPGITTLTDPMPEAAALRLTRRTTTGEPMNLAQVHSFGFGGLNAVAMLQKAPS
jgi:3-oxoacyl-[acyl-carrier-protein] synthase II